MRQFLYLYLNEYGDKLAMFNVSDDRLHQLEKDYDLPRGSLVDVMNAEYVPGTHTIVIDVPVFREHLKSKEKR